jgi:hypothetical protein
MKFFLALFVGVAVAAPSLPNRQTGRCAVYETCFQFPLPCPSGHVRLKALFKYSLWLANMMVGIEESG